MQPSDRLKNLLEALHISEHQLTQRMGASTSHFKRTRENNAPISMNSILRITRAYPQVNADFLEYGTGPVLLQPAPSGAIGHQPLQPYNPDIKVLPVTVDAAGRENIVFVRSQAQAGYINNLQEPEYLAAQPVFSLPHNEFKNATYRCFEIRGDSMAPTIFPGDWLIGRYLDNWSQIRDGYVHIVVTREGIVVKRLLNRINTRNELVLNSDNPDYPTLILDPAEIQEIWYVKARLSFKFENTANTMKADIQNLKADVAELKQVMGN